MIIMLLSARCDTCTPIGRKSRRSSRARGLKRDVRARAPMAMRNAMVRVPRGMRNLRLSAWMRELRWDKLRTSRNLSLEVFYLRTWQSDVCRRKCQRGRRFRAWHRQFIACCNESCQLVIIQVVIWIWIRVVLSNNHRFSTEFTEKVPFVVKCTVLLLGFTIRVIDTFVPPLGNFNPEVDFFATWGINLLPLIHGCICNRRIFCPWYASLTIAALDSL